MGSGHWKCASRKPALSILCQKCSYDIHTMTNTQKMPLSMLVSTGGTPLLKTYHLMVPPAWLQKNKALLTTYSSSSSINNQRCLNKMDTHHYHYLNLTSVKMLVTRVIIKQSFQCLIFNLLNLWVPFHRGVPTWGEYPEGENLFSPLPWHATWVTSPPEAATFLCRLSPLWDLNLHQLSGPIREGPGLSLFLKPKEGINSKHLGIAQIYILPVSLPDS